MFTVLCSLKYFLEKEHSQNHLFGFCQPPVYMRAGGDICMVGAN